MRILYNNNGTKEIKKMTTLEIFMIFWILFGTVLVAYDINEKK